MSDVEARVARGAALLDRENPTWWNHIYEPVRISSCNRCVLGQVYGDYDHGKLALGLGTTGGGIPFGFACQTWLSGSPASWIIETAALEAAWRAEIDTRVEAAADVASQHGAVVDRTLDAVLV
jgi:hypothetical protein